MHEYDNSITLNTKTPFREVHFILRHLAYEYSDEFRYINDKGKSILFIKQEQGLRKLGLIYSIFGYHEDDPIASNNPAIGFYSSATNLIVEYKTKNPEIFDLFRRIYWIIKNAKAVTVNVSFNLAKEFLSK